MHPAAKLVIGLLIFVAGIYWYAGPSFNARSGGTCDLLGFCPTREFMGVFVGLFGIGLIFLGLVVAWIEYEDIKWSSREGKKKK
jgi:hypothetical protein